MSELLEIESGRYPLSKIAEVNPSLPKKVSDETLVSFVTMSDVKEEGGLYEFENKLFREVRSGFTRFIENDVIFAKITPCMENGKGALAKRLSNGLACGSTEFHVLRANSDGCPEYIYQITKDDSYRQKAEMYMTGSAGQRRVPSDFFKKFEVYIPSKKQQKKIAKILSTVDNLIEKTQSLIDKYTAIKQGMMADLFTRGIDMTTGTHCGKLRPSVEDAPDLYKQTELGWVPKDWDDTKLGKYIEKYLYGPRFDAGQYSIDGNVKTIRGTDFTKYGEILYEQVPIAEIPIGKIKHHILKQGDLVVITTADCGLTAVFEEQDYAYIPSAYAVKLKLIEGADPYFIKAYMQTDLAERQVNKYVRQGTLGNLPGSDLLDFFIAMPSLNEQQAIVSKLTSVEQLIVKEKFYLAKMHKKKKGLMQDLLTGKVQVS
ncbi:MAG: restriction endonuclease subunit S [Thalassolituus sp.]|uniref:restriction endonuclease subunit S n=1 Tax=Thalassolituus TaxID=187492 RepID=UPI001CE38609|nr:restriction endonuclease subunit S [Thalassolituus oleivorans]